jgi:hypothetical protein
MPSRGVDRFDRSLTEHQFRYSRGSRIYGTLWLPCLVPGVAMRSCLSVAALFHSHARPGDCASLP